ncbi:hypothetical protein GGI18_005968 [Coemansia linderi]|uniref:Uncharacterized protein n=1 Tax=Coemansia linderi TaxID=2663919 RepID=A0ACC1JTA6_9FUNG|nr:hypothetical protein GGI18_005968 [Coemansia linderi]
MALVIYTGSSCIYPGTNEASAGVGVFLGHGSMRNFSGRLPGLEQTSQRAELGAIKRALLILGGRSMKPQIDDEPVFIKTRSKYAIGCVTEWPLKWVRNGWVSNRGVPIANKDLIIDIITLMLLSPYKVHFIHTPAAMDDASSMRAQAMASRAARRGC